MPNQPLKNFHLPLPESVYLKLPDEARAQGEPATVLAREAIEMWIAKKDAERLQASIRAYAESHAGTDLDLNPALEKAAIESLIDAIPKYG